MKHRLRKTSAVITLLLLCLLLLASCSSAGKPAQTGTISLTEVTQADGVRSVTLNSRGTKLTVRSTLSSGFVDNNSRTTVYLFEIPAGAGADSLSGLEPVYSFRASTKSTWSAPLVEGSLTRLYCSYVLATKGDDGSYTPLGVPVPVLNPEVLAPGAETYPEAMSIKGLAAGSVADILTLGASHAVLDVAIEDFIAIPSPADPALNTTDYVFNGITYHFSTDALRALDRKVRILSAESVIVYLRFTLSTHPAILADKLSCLGFADAPEGARHYAININNEDCAGNMAALFEFLAKRYTRSDRSYGFCGAFIVGHDVNDWSVSNAAGGGVDPQEYVAAYARLVRLARIALVSNYAHGRVYISLGSNWNTPADSPGGMSSNAFLASFNATNTASGDYNWGVAVSAEALDPADSSIWDDALATGASSQYLSPANINVLTYALSKNYTFAGGRRSVICTFGVSGDPADTPSLDNQAASYAYAYYKAAADSDIDALIYSPLYDSGEDNRGLAAENGTKKPAWEVFTLIDTKDDDPVVAAAAPAGSEFSYMYGNLSEAVKVKSRFSGESATAVDTKKFKLSTIFDFTQGELSGFEPVSTGAGIDLQQVNSRPMLRILGIGDAGIIRVGVSSLLLSDAGYLAVDIPQSTGEGKLTLRLSQNSKDRRITYEATGAYLPGNQTVYFDISEFAKAIDREDINLSLWINPADKEAPYELMISSISAASSRSTAASILWIVVLFLLVFFVLLLLLALFYRLYHKIRRRRARKNSGQPNTALANRDDNT